MKEVIRGESIGTKQKVDIDFEILDDMKGCNIADKLYYVQSVNNIVKSINEDKLGDTRKRTIYVIENEGIMNDFEIVTIEQLEEIVMVLPKKKGTDN